MNAQTPKKPSAGARGISFAALFLAVILVLGALLPSCTSEQPTPTGKTAASETAAVTGGTESGGATTPAGTSGTTGTGEDPTPSAEPTPTGYPTETEITGFYSKKEGTVYFSPVSVAVDDGGIFVADATNETVSRFGADGTPEKTVELDGPASKVIVSGGKVYVLAGEYGGKLYVFDRDLTKEKTITVGHTPLDLWINGNEAFVCNRFSGTVSVVDLEKGRVTAAIEVSREPGCMAAAGNVLYVGSRLQDGSALDATLSSKIVKIDMTSKKVIGSVALQNGVTNLRSMAVTPDGAQIIVTHTVARYTYPTTQLDRGWVNTNGFTVLDVENDSAVAYLLDDVESGAANPWGAAVSDDGKSLFVTTAGTGELFRVDLTKLKEKKYIVESGHDGTVSSMDRAIDRIDYLSGMKTRVKLPGEGARSVTFADGKLYVGEYFSGTVTTLDAKTMKTQGSFSVGVQPEKSPERLGEALWNDATYCYQTWESCSSCHPDGRPDGLNWDEGGDGWGTPKNTKSMIFSTRTPPVLATGVMDTAEDNVMGTVREAFRSMLEDDKVECMNAYLRSLLPVDSPYLAPDGGYTPEALRGKELFESKGCAACHPAPLYTDLQFHRSSYLGSDGSLEDRAFITPTLVEIWRSAPYTYCGCETDLSEVIKKFSRDALTDAEVSDLKAFLLSIGTVGEYYGVSEVYSEKDGQTVIGRFLPGSRIDSLTLYKQIPSASGIADPVITVTLMFDDGSVLAEAEFTPGPLVYGREIKLSLVNFGVPANAGAGTKLTVSIKDGAGAPLATDYVLTCKG